jgi:hypothetical protein
MESVVGKAAASGKRGGGKRVIVDRCNPEPRDRQAWVGIAHQPKPADAMLVVFDVDVEVCCRRVSTRVGHPTIAAGQPNAQAIVRSFAKRWAPPRSAVEAAAEGYGRYACIRDPADARALLVTLGADPAAVDELGGAAAAAGPVALVRTRSAEERARRLTAEAVAHEATQEAEAIDAELAAVQRNVQALRRESRARAARKR